MEIKLPWGNKEIRINTPAKWEFLGEIKSDYLGTNKALSKIEEVELIRRSLLNPIKKKPLSQIKLSDKKITVVVDDLARRTPVDIIFPEVLSELHKGGAKKENIDIIIALGTHRFMTEKEIEIRLGNNYSDDYNIINHNCYDKNMLKFVGKTSKNTDVSINRFVVEADIVILIGIIEPHALAGFGGGLKNVIPGCAGIDTIATTHLHGSVFERINSIGKIGEECYSRILLEEGAQLIKGDYFLVNTVLYPEGEISGVFTGDPIIAHRQGSKLAAKIYGSKLDKKADIVITSSFPMDTDLRQGVKCLETINGAVKENGLVIACIRCKYGAGDIEIPPYLLDPPAMQLFSREIGVTKLVDIRKKTWGKMSLDSRFMLELLTELCRRYSILVYAPDLSPDAARKLGVFEHFSKIDKLIEKAVEIKPGKKTFYAIPKGAITYIKN